MKRYVVAFAALLCLSCAPKSFSDPTLVLYKENPVAAVLLQSKLQLQIARDWYRNACVDKVPGFELEDQKICELYRNKIDPTYVFAQNTAVDYYKKHLQGDFSDIQLVEQAVGNFALLIETVVPLYDVNEKRYAYVYKPLSMILKTVVEILKEHDS